VFGLGGEYEPEKELRDLLDRKEKIEGEWNLDSKGYFGE
jgi:hypothetical protein